MPGVEITGTPVENGCTVTVIVTREDGRDEEFVGEVMYNPETVKNGDVVFEFKIVHWE